jgi:glucokinase
MERFICGIDLGGTKLTAGLVKTDGTLVDSVLTNDHVNKDEDGIVADMAAIVNELLNRNGLEEENLIGIGVGFPGHIRSKAGVTITTSNFKAKFKNYPIRQNFQKYFPNTNIIMDNDANAQAYAEYKYGAGRGYKDVVFITLSTGIGAGIIIDGKLIRGMSGTAGEIGHTIVNTESHRMCTCGNEGCVMGLASGLNLSGIAADKLRYGITTKLDITLENVKSTVNGFTIGKGLEIDDELSKAVVFESADYAGVAVYNIFQLLNPEVVILGGGLMNWGDIYLNRIKSKFYSLAKDMMFDNMEIVPAKVGRNSGILGAAALCLENI